MLAMVDTRADKPKVQGFSLIELMITVAVLGVLTTLAYLNFSTWIQNTKTRSVAEALQNGIRLAQTEAVTRGRNVQFFLTSETPKLGATSSETGKNWVIRAMKITDATEADVFIQGASLSDAATVVTTAPKDPIRFNSIGRLVSPTKPVAYTVRNTSSSSELRKLNVTISIAGKVRMCDADKILSATNPDGCEPTEVPVEAK